MIYYVAERKRNGNESLAFTFAGMAELADAYGSGPYEGNFMQVQVLLPAPTTGEFSPVVFLFCREGLVFIFGLPEGNQPLFAARAQRHACCFLGSAKKSKKSKIIVDKRQKILYYKIRR